MVTVGAGSGGSVWRYEAGTRSGFGACCRSRPMRGPVHDGRREASSLKSLWIMAVRANSSRGSARLCVGACREAWPNGSPG